jgi:hypothetical protein
MIKAKKKLKKTIKAKKASVKPIKKKAVKTKKVIKPVKKKTAKNKRFKLTAGPLTESQISMFLEHYKEHQCFPGSKVPCTITGKLTTCVGPWMKRKIEEYGGPENFLRKYRCRGALKKAKQIIKGVKPRKQKQKRKDEEGNYIIPSLPQGTQRPISQKEMTEMSRSVCLRPDIFLDNGRHCEGCMHFDLCENALKCKADPKKNYHSKPTLRMFTNRPQN